MNNDRRRSQRVTLRQPMRGAVGDARVYVVDASLAGIRIAHQSPLPTPGSFCRVEMPSDVGPIKLDCQVIRTVTQNAIFQTGLSIAAADRQSSERLRALLIQK